MKIFSSKNIGMYGAPNYPECPTRVPEIIKLLDERGVKIDFVNRHAVDGEILPCHSAHYIDDLKNGSFQNSEAPEFENIFMHASLSAGTGLEAMDYALSGKNSFSLMRPPGHHAGKDIARGFCYLNNAAIAARYALDRGARKVAMLDIDNHHGNGTQELVWNLDGVLHADIHKHPDYPGTGDESFGNCINLPLSERTNEHKYLMTLDYALDRINKFSPSVLIVSAGFDTHKADPVGGLGLETQSYGKIAKKIKDLGIPTCSLLEGGYNVSALPECVFQYISRM